MFLFRLCFLFVLFVLQQSRRHNFLVNYLHTGNTYTQRECSALPSNKNCHDVQHATMLRALPALGAQKVLQGLPQEVPKGSQNPPKIIKIGPCSQMAPQGHPGMPLGTPGPPKWSPGTSKVTIWDLKSDHFTLISNHVLYQN